MAGAAMIIAALVGVAAAQEVPLVTLAKNGHWDAVRTAVQRGAAVNVPAADGSVPLHWAAYREQPDAVALLINAGADANAVNRLGVTALSLAAMNGNVAIVKRLLAAGAKPNTALVGGESPLMTASRAGNVDAVQALLAAGADVNARENTRGQTALMWAAAEGHAETVRILLAAGADVQARASGPTGPREAALDTGARGNPNTSGLLLFSGVRGPRLDAFNALMFAARNGRIDTAAVLVDAGSKVNELGPSGITVLELAVANAHYDLAVWLLEKGADPNVAEIGWTALHRLARVRRPNFGFVPGPVATSHITSLELAKRLIAAGAAVNARQTKPVDDGYRQQFRIGATPFWLAAKYADLELMHALLQHGADPTMATDNGTTPLMAAAGIGTVTPGEDTGSAEDSLEAVKLCSQRADVNAANRDGDTALHGAARVGFDAVIEFLAAKGAKLDVTNKKGLTPLAMAEAEGLAGTAKLLRDLQRIKPADRGRP